MVDLMQTSDDKQSSMREGAGENVFGSLPPESRGRFPALKLVLTYAVAGALWILFSDILVSWLVRDPATAGHVQTYKGWFFVAVTALLLWFLTQRFLNQLRRSEAVLRESERNYREVFNATADAIFIHDAATGRILRVNQAMLRMYGYSAEQEVIGLNADDLSANDPAFSRAAAESRIRKALQEQQQMFEWRAKRKNGELFWVEVALRSSRIGGQECVLAVVRDITERRGNEEELCRFRFSIEQASDAVFWMNRDAGFSYVNDQTCRSLGYTREELLKLRLWDIDPVYAKERWEADWEQYQREPRVGSHQIETLHRRKDGSVFPVEVSAKHIWFGETELHVAFVRDITERRRAEEATRENELRLRTMVQNAPAIIFILDRDGVFRLSEGQALAKLGLEPGEVVGKSALEMYRDTPSVLESLRKALAGEPARAINELPGVIFDTVYSPIFDPDGKPAGLIGIAIDITDRKRAEEAQMLLATAVEQAAEAIVITDAGGTISYVNPAFEKITGYARDEVIGQNARMLRSGKHDAAFYRHLWETIARGEVWTSRIFNKKKNGALYEEEMIISPVFDSAGKIVNYVAVKRDVTQEVALETQLRQAQKMEAIGQLAGGVAHDFNNILTVIQGSASLLLNPQLKPAEKSDCSHQIIRAAERAAGLIRQLLLFGRKQVMQPVNLDLNEVVGGMTRMLKRILGEDIALRSDFAPSLPPVFGDAGMIEQVVLNLAINSRDAMPGGGRLAIATGAETLDERQAQLNPDASPGPHVWLAVSDTGCGIPPENLPRIFEPFFTTKDVGKGTGLGLATVYGIIQQHRGWITVDSEPGKGSTFRICLPAAAGARAGEKPPALQLQLPRGTETVLLVEDDLPVRLLVGNLLQRCGYIVLQAESGAAALRIWREHLEKIHLLLTDLVMPDGVTGRQLARQLQSEKPDLKVIYTSGYSAEAGEGPALIDGVNFLQKPYPSGKLAKTVRNCLDHD
jgi:PAS domain S-box-containing protein